MPNLYALDTTQRPDLNNHPELKEIRPSQRGIADSCVFQYAGTNVFQWWKQGADARWRPHGELIVLFESERLQESENQLK